MSPPETKEERILRFEAERESEIRRPARQISVISNDDDYAKMQQAAANQRRIVDDAYRNVADTLVAYLTGNFGPFDKKDMPQEPPATEGEGDFDPWVYEPEYEVERLAANLSGRLRRAVADPSVERADEIANVMRGLAGREFLFPDYEYGPDDSGKEWLEKSVVDAGNAFREEVEKLLDSAQERVPEKFKALYRDEGTVLDLKVCVAEAYLEGEEKAMEGLKGST
ncbi:hypothetical protein K402DRAFT_417084 [Aulographum hederae CBS 113979]|uniref:Uncharacterized protein n=1 Tax=Aulographum hederae CBS 113979 TaxID=1176131 RepID=A0A6G1HD77_9PEZI|nr:hypothetical protein K402DRAFT_417084 [Aulographum hederae CBS 113979]